MKMTGAKIIIECLLEQGVDIIFGYPGGQIMPLYDALYDYTEDGRIRHILTSHEQGATHAADGYARSTGKVGVCFATSGPGAANTVTGIATANIDSSPIIVITGQVPIASIGKDAFQEIDIVGVTLPIVKHSFSCRSIEQLADAVRQAFRIAISERPGPVLIDVPKDLMLEKTDYIKKEPVEKRPTPVVDPEKLAEFADLINKAKKPVIYAGGGVTISNSSAELTELAEKNQIPVATTLMSLGNFNRRSPLSLGMVGMHGERHANLAFDDSDLLISIGARFSDRVTGNPDTFAKRAKVIQIDIDRSEVGKNIGADHMIIGDVNDVLKELIPMIEKNDRTDWKEKIDNWKTDSPNQSDVFDHDRIFEIVNDELGDDVIVATDVGQHQMWTAQRWPFTKPRKMITSGGLGTMGFGLGAAIGSKFANPDERVILFSGDGSFRMNCNELMTVAAQNLPIIVFVLKNNTLGMVRQWQKLFFNKRYSATDLPDIVDYGKLCSAFGLNGWEVDNEKDLRKAIKEAVDSNKGAVIACDIYIDENVWPIVPPGDSITNQVMEE